MSGADVRKQRSCQVCEKLIMYMNKNARFCRECQSLRKEEQDKMYYHIHKLKEQRIYKA